MTEVVNIVFYGEIRENMACFFLKVPTLIAINVRPSNTSYAMLIFQLAIIYSEVIFIEYNSAMPKWFADTQKKKKGQGVVKSTKLLSMLKKIKPANIILEFWFIDLLGGMIAASYDAIIISLISDSWLLSSSFNKSL